ncbi:pyridoxamine 5'-phosphate oxidase family protein [Candidatus Saccharibacteria bacterium]|nr:pyridoxamine 5'-phosphate oxidase family protein [Candidatus Saccharibacteria bacterium]
MENDEARKKLFDLIKDIRVCMLTTMTEDGRHVSRPMGVQHVEGDNDLWFFTYANSAKARQIASHPMVNLGFSNDSKNDWVSISGTAELVRDRSKMEELWNPFLKAWFPDDLETPEIALLRVRADTAEYWDSPNGGAIALFGSIKAAVTGKPPKTGDNETVQL